MEFITSTIEYVKAHGDDILAIIGGIVAVATVIVKLTPTPKDDSLLDKLVSFIAKFGLLNTSKDQAAIDAAKESK